MPEAPPVAVPAGSPALSVSTQAMVHATALAMANATHVQACAQQINAATAAALAAVIMRAGTAMQADVAPSTPNAPPGRAGDHHG